MLPEIGHDLRRLQAEYDIPIDMNEAVVSYVRFFQTPVVRKHFVKWLGRSPGTRSATAPSCGRRGSPRTPSSSP